MKAASIGARARWIWCNRSGFAQPTYGQQPRLLLDISTIIQDDARTGIQRVVRAVWSELVRRSGRGFVVVPVFATYSAGYRYAPLDFLNRRPRELDSAAVSAGPGDRFLGLDLTTHLLPKYRRQIRAWRANGATVHLLVYDLLPLVRPDWFSRSTAQHFRNWFDVLAKDVDQAICISAKVERDLRQQLERVVGVRQPFVHRVQLGGDLNASVPSIGINEQVSRLLERMRFRPAILMVGTIEPRKGYDVALAAFEYLWKTVPAEAPDLIIVGRAGWKTMALQQRIRLHQEHSRRLHWLEGVSDEGLSLFYQTCRGLLMASHDEGFGLPLAEAAAHGRPVLARNLSVFREQGLPNTQFFDDDRPAALALQIMGLLATNRHKSAPTQQLPSWSDCADGLLMHLCLNTLGEECVSPSLLRAS